MNIGFTGTQQGMSANQELAFVEYLQNLVKCNYVKEFHHGDCIGADTDAHNLVRKHFPEIHIIIHPPIINAKRAFNKGDTVLSPKEYLERNHDIVDVSAILIATPHTVSEQLRSGTWATIRYARKKHKIVARINNAVFIEYPRSN